MLSVIYILGMDAQMPTAESGISTKQSATQVTCITHDLQEQLSRSVGLQCMLQSQHDTGVKVRQAPIWSVHLDQLKWTKKLRSCHILSFASQLVLLLQAGHVTTESSDQPVSDIRRLIRETRCARPQKTVALPTCHVDDPSRQRPDAMITWYACTLRGLSTVC